MASQKMIVKDVINKSDILLEVIDARFPEETRHSEIERDLKRLKKPFIIVLNKCDLVSKEKIEKARSRMAKTAPSVFVSSKERFGTTMLRHKMLEVADIQGRDITVGCIGYPNTGKSSVINGVAGKEKHQLHPFPGIPRDCRKSMQDHALFSWIHPVFSPLMSTMNIFRDSWELRIQHILKTQ
ncbi:MAG: GTPase [Methanolobus sp.]